MRFMPEYESAYSVYHASRNERLNDTKTRTPPAAVYLLLLLKRGDDRASHLRQNVKAEFAVPSNVPYYLEVGRYNKVKYQVEPSELRMEFYLEIMKLFCRVGENSSAFTTVRSVFWRPRYVIFRGTAGSQPCIILDLRIMFVPSLSSVGFLTWS